MTETPHTPEDEIEAGLIEAELFLKYQVPHRAIERLRSGIERRPHSVRLRERLREVAATNNQPEEAARQCLALANIYITREDFDHAHERLLEAKQHDARISIASGLEAIRRARHPLNQNAIDTSRLSLPPRPVLAGELAFISVFDIIQVLENSRHTGSLLITLKGDGAHPETFQLYFNEGNIVGAWAHGLNPMTAFRRTLETPAGTFEFETATAPFPVTIHPPSNTNLILDTLRQLDEERDGRQ